MDGLRAADCEQRTCSADLIFCGDEHRVLEGRLPGLIVVCFGRFWVRGLPFPNAMHLGHPFQWKNTLPWHLGPAAKVRILRFKNLPPFRHYRGLQTTFEVFTRVGPDNSLERLTEQIG